MAKLPGTVQIKHLLVEQLIRLQRAVLFILVEQLIRLRRAVLCT